MRPATASVTLVGLLARDPGLLDCRLVDLVDLDREDVAVEDHETAGDLAVGAIVGALPRTEDLIRPGTIMRTRGGSLEEQPDPSTDRGA